MPERYSEIHACIKEGGFRNGFVCLLYGAPGTSKTELVYQFFRWAGRCIMAVNVPDIKSKWMGESEMNIQEVLDRYRLAVERSEKAPILLCNAAEGILGIRQEGTPRSVDKLEKPIQNIILQKMEKQESILIVTTNLTQNSNPAFKLRFLYKICIERPDASVLERVWHTMISSLSSKNAPCWHWPTTSSGWPSGQSSLRCFV